MFPLWSQKSNLSKWLLKPVAGLHVSAEQLLQRG